MLPNGFYNLKCESAMKQLPEQYFDLAIVDPPYGDVKAGGYMTGKSAGGVAKHPKYNNAIWAQGKPEQSYFDELFRVSRNQIIWGGNYFTTMIKRDSACWIVWDKCNGGNKFADVELAWTSFKGAARMIRFMWNGMMQGKSVTDGHIVQGKKSLNEVRIHPTQKPVMLYQWLLTNYAEPGYRILDTHVGSASSLVACHRLGYEYWGFESEKEYYDSANKRLREEMAQVSIFNFENRYEQIDFMSGGDEP